MHDYLFIQHKKPLFLIFMLKKMMLCIISLLWLLIILWGAFALDYQLPVLFTGFKILTITVWCLISLLILWCIWVRQWKTGLLSALICIVALMLWWSSVKPSNHRIWADDVAMQLQGEVKDNIVTLHHVRNFNWRTDDDYDIHWEDRQYDLNKLQSIDVSLSYWMGPAIAHTLVSFGFDDGHYVTFSVEIRKKKGDSFSAIGGFFKQFEASIVAADERDILYVRTNVRGEQVHLYRIAMSDQAKRALFLSYVNEANELIIAPRFYNTLTANCTTIVFEMVRHIISGLPMDYRLIVSGYLPQYLYQIGALNTDYPLAQLTQAGDITERAKSYGHGQQFSSVIREGIPPLRQP